MDHVTSRFADSLRGTRDRKRDEERAAREEREKRRETRDERRETRDERERQLAAYTYKAMERVSRTSVYLGRVCATTYQLESARLTMYTDGLLTLHYGKHPATLAAEVGAWYTGDRHVDVTLACDDGSVVKAHRVVLAAASPLLASLLRNPALDHVVHLSGVRKTQLTHLLEFLYNGEALIPSTELTPLRELFELLQIKSELFEPNQPQTSSNSDPERIPTPQPSEGQESSSYESQYDGRQSNNPADCCSVLIKTEGCEEEPEVDVEGVEGETLLAENRESSIEPPRRRDSSDPVNLSLNSGTSTTSESSHDIVPRPEKQLLERRESLEEAEERRRQLAARLALGLEPGKRKPEEIPIPPAEAYIVTPHRKRRPGFHNAPAQNPAFVPFNPGFETPRRLQAPHPLSVSAPPYLISSAYGRATCHTSTLLNTKF
ncbi:transcription factor Ken 2 isoform X3 [Bombus affinis]|uniref:transcription factor Ken 2 isoform X3 n=1 Tax=Bombus affinis TaxID=309941 RepID=UPI0021B7E875|nr:transcription factor Ken 2 isoform X3 [Bombus affinis]